MRPSTLNLYILDYHAFTFQLTELRHNYIYITQKYKQDFNVIFMMVTFSPVTKQTYTTFSYSALSM